MFKLKEFYQYRRELFKRNKVFRSRTLKLPTTKIVSKESYAQGTLYLKTTQNNTIATLTDLKGRVQVVKSCGCLGFQGKKKRSTKFAIESTLFSVIQKAKEFQWKYLDVYIKGFAKGRFYILSCLKKSNVKLGLIRDITPIPHNGCRLKKLRRG